MKKIKIAAMADLHMQHSTIGSFRSIFEEINQMADILLLCGDLTNEGFPDEAQLLIEELSFCRVPIAGVLGNHDYTQNKHEQIKKIISQRMAILSEQSYIFENIGFAGVKGFGGGFDNHSVLPFGEEILKQFVYETVSEAMHLEKALAELETEKKVVVLHYSPIRQTIEGESPEIFPLMGSSRLVDPIENFNATAVFHGHAHHGSPEGKTNRGIPVYNVSMPLLSKTPPHKPYKIIEI